MELSIKSSFVNWLPESLENGKTAVIALTVNDDKSYEALYWTDDVNETLTIDAEFLLLFNVDLDEKLPFYYALIDDIKTVLQ